MPAKSGSRGSNPVDIWSRFDPAVLNTGAPAITKTEEKEEAPQRWRRTRRILLELSAGLLWTWVALKVFVGDIDRWALSRWAPDVTWLLDYRFFGLLALLALSAIVIRGKKWFAVLYVVFWPGIVLLYRVPRFLYLRQSVVATVGVVHLVTGFARGWRFTAIVVALIAFSILALLTGSQAIVVGCAGAILLGIWLITLWKVVGFALSPGRFVRHQHETVERLLRTSWLDHLTQVPAELTAPDITKYNSEQANKLLTQMSMALVVTRGVHYWSESLEDYRKSTATMLTACLAVLGIFLHGIVTFAFVNFAIYKTMPAQYAVTYEPTLATFFYYTFSAAAFSEIGAVVPVGSLATAVHILTGLGTGILVLMILLALALAYRQSAVEPSTERAIQQMRGAADEWEERIAENYGLEDRDALFVVMGEVGGGIFKILPFLLRRLPKPQGRGNRRP